MVGSGLSEGDGRGGRWYEAAIGVLVPDAVRPDRGEAVTRSRDLGAVRVCEVVASGPRAPRTPELVPAQAPSRYHLVLALSGTFGIAQAGREAVLGAGDLVLCGTSRPLRRWAVPDRELSARVVVQFPEELLPLPPEQVDRLLAVRLPGREGLGALLAGSLRELLAGASGGHAARLADISLDLLAALLARELAVEPEPFGRGRHRALLAQVRHHIAEHLSAPDLSPASVAAAHHLSVRHLHRLFAERGTSVAATIRALRLERCRRDLASSGELVHVVAARWGFTDPAHFSRLFRGTFGLSPSEHREVWAGLRVPEGPSEPA
ncbi:helix-turn-helix domain-containing protein [Saccharothrix coeruleofusca]|uniref:HTH araC/xylS-type domain-containing protein n=1 Tax=Saccharothrix coeruleofusca TaxID=33919 RepID=A0A918AQU1_9PSEU|nr:helix-turn-helix domain-containing protein [Saccharothrix coeruleofusca]GGP71090.1 hypothetical protein GCM10010185_50150 [Saccharothrix coeruleofusca]